MQIVEIPVVVNESIDCAALFSSIGQSELRRYEGMDFSSVQLDESHQVYFYFLDQAKPQYHYLWDMIIPHSPGCLVVCDWKNKDILDQSMKSLEYLENRFSTPAYACVLGTPDSLPESLKESGFTLGSDKRLRFLTTSDKESVKKVLAGIFDNQ